MYRLYKSLQKVVLGVFTAIVYFSMCFIPVILCAQVIGRKFLHSPIMGAEELASFAFTAMVLFGSAIVCYKKQYIVVDVFVKNFKGAVRKVLTLIADLLTGTCFGALIYCFYEAIPAQAKFASPIFQVPKSVYSIALIIVFIFMLVCMVENVIRDIKAFGEKEEA